MTAIGHCIRSILFLYTVTLTTYPFNTDSKKSLWNSYLEEEKKHTLWIHAPSRDDILSVELLIRKLQKIAAGINFFVTIGSLESKTTADEYLPSNVDLKILLNDDLQNISIYFKRINPSAIITMGHDLPINALLLAFLKKIPTYLIGSSFCHQTERAFVTNSFLYIPIFNLFKKIFVNKVSDIQIFKNFEISTPSIHFLGNLNAFNIVEKKHFYLEKLKMNEEKIKEMFPYPILLINPLNKENLNHYLQTFNKLKENYKEIKMILIPENIFQWTYSTIDKIKKLGFSVFTWDQTTHTLNYSKNIFSTFKPIFDNNDIIVALTHNDHFFLHAIASIYILDGNISEVKNQKFMETAIWKNPTIVVGPFDIKDPKSNQNNLTYHDNNEICDSLIKEIPLIKCKTIEEITTLIPMLLNNKKLAQSLGEHAFNELKKLSKEANKNLEPLFKDLKEIFHN